MAAYTDDEFLRDLDTLNAPQGNLRLMVYRPDDDHDYGVRWDVLNPAAAQADFSWGPDIEYNENDIVTFEDQIWISQQDNNQGVLPGTDPLFWLVGVKGMSGLVPWVAGIFTENNVSVYYDDGLGLLLYVLINPTRPYNSVDILTEISLGDWQIIGTPPIGGSYWPLSGTGGLTSNTQIDAGNLYGIEFSGLTYFLLGSGDPLFPGAQYTFDPEPNFTGMSLVHKQYVDDLVSSSTGWPLTGDANLTGDVRILGGQNRSIRLGATGDELDSFNVQVNAGAGSQGGLDINSVVASLNVFNGNNNSLLINGFDDSVKLLAFASIRLDAPDIDFMNVTAPAVVGVDVPTHTVQFSLDGVPWKFFVKLA